VYAVGLNNMDLNMRKMLLWILTAVAHSVVVFWIPYGLYAPVDGSEDGKHGWTDGMDVAGLMTFSSLCWGMQVKVALEMHSWTWLNNLFLIVSL
jgi:magnesium-transporting ATPase (P-type)